MPGVESILNLPNCQLVKVKNEENIKVLARYLKYPDQCPHCEISSQFYLKEHTERRFKHTVVGNRIVDVKLWIRKWKCRQCRRCFSDRIPGLLPRSRASQKFKQEVFTEHEQGISKKDLSKNRQISSSTVERWYEMHVSYRLKELSGRKAPIVMGIDEHFFSHKHGFATTFVDLRNNKVFDVALGRSEALLQGKLKGFKGRENVKVVVMDLSETYRSIVRKYFPNAMIVADRFHVIRLINHHFIKTWASLDPEGRKSRGLKKLLSKHQKNLNSDQVSKLGEYFVKFPVVKTIWEFKQDLAQLLLHKTQSKQSCRQLVTQLLWTLDQLKICPFQHLQTLSTTLQSWIEPIVRMWRFTKNNGITEGLHTKMELISRRAYGFRNFENYRRRVIALCGWNGVFVRRF